MFDYLLFIFYLSAIILLEVLIRRRLKDDSFLGGIGLPLIFSIPFASGLFLLSTSLNSGFNQWISFFLTLILCILFASQLVYYCIFRTFYIVYSAGNAGDAMEFAGIAISTIRDNLAQFLTMFIPFAAFIILSSLGAPRFSSTPWEKAVVALMGFVFHILGLYLVKKGDRSVNSAYNLYYNIHQPEFSVENMGVMTYMRLDLKRQLFGWSPKHLPYEEDIKRYEKASGNDRASEINQELCNMLPLDFMKLAENEADEKVKQLHRYFSIIRPSKKNDYTGLFKDHNLILITAESFSHMAIRGDVTPTLYRMVHEGFNFKSFYTPIWGVSTTDGEYVATAGLLPKPGDWSYPRSKDNYMPFAMGNQLRKRGYLTKAYHNHSYDYYERHLTHQNMGYEYKGLGNGLDVGNTWPESDLEMMEKTIPEYIDHEKFHAYYMSVSGHMIYRFDKNSMAEKNRQLVKQLPYSDSVKAYLAGQIELDRALEYLLKRLEDEGIAEKTLIAISSDHYPYGLTLEEQEELKGGKIERNFELYRNAFILYSRGMDPMTIDTPTCSLDILPTLSNLMGLEFDSRLMMGRDAFSDKPPLVTFSNRSFITDRGRFNSITGDFIPFGDFMDAGDKEKESYIKSVSELIDARFLYSSWMLESDYYRKVLGGV
ncbi:MAG: sulfatase-like hydrolase/transferase [Gudongella sp.]|nr:sulfatase-like hydrolase/transferase [Gudongella sp.]